jgi:transcriptional regulator with XRE-family HTH domain
MYEASIPAGDFADRLRRARERKHLTPCRLAQLCNWSQQGVLNLERPDADPKLSAILKLARALGVPPWELLPGWPPSTAVDQTPPTGVDQPGRPPASACTIKDTERCLKAVWSLIQDAHDTALDGDWEDAAAHLKHLLAHLDDIAPDRVCPSYWGAVGDCALPALERAIALLQGDVAMAVHRYGELYWSYSRYCCSLLPLLIFSGPSSCPLRQGATRSCAS